MVSLVARHMLAALGGMIALLAVPGSGFTQSPLERLAADDDSNRLADEIRAAQATGGPRSPDLIDPLTEIAALLAAEGEKALAIAALEEARHVVRATYGLYTLDQAPLMVQALEHQRALGAFEMVQALEEELLDLAARHPGDLRTVAIHRDIGERRMDLLRRFRAQEYPGEIYPQSGLWSVEPNRLVMSLVLRAQQHYADGIGVLLRNGIYSSDELRDLELKMVRAADLVRQQDKLDLRSTQVGARKMDQMGLAGGHYLPSGVWVPMHHELREQTNTLWDLASSESSEETKQRRYRVDHITSQYGLARESYRRLIDYAETVADSAPADGAAWRSRLEAYLQLADWDLVYSENGAALDEYAQVHAMLVAAENAETLIAEIFAPPAPVLLPTFLPNPLETPTSDRFIDVVFEVTRYGNGRRIQIVGAAADVSDAEKDELVALITSSRFRPRVTDGELVTSPIRLRYFIPE